MSLHSPPKDTRGAMIVPSNNSRRNISRYANSDAAEVAETRKIMSTTDGLKWASKEPIATTGMTKSKKRRIALLAAAGIIVVVAVIVYYFTANPV